MPLGAKPDIIAKHRDAWNPVYAAMIETLDDCVGRLLARLDALGLRERTLVIFTSDNGRLHVLESPETPAMHKTPFRAGKGYVYEGGLRIPLIVRWPGKIRAGAVEAMPVISTDWVRTWLAVTGIESPGKLDGISLAGLLTGAETLPPRALCWHFPHYTNQGSRPAGAIRAGDWKLIEHYEDERAELFDLAGDPGETTDLARQHPGKVAELRGKLAAWRQEMGAQENTPKPRFDMARWKRIYQDSDTSRLAAGATAAETRASLTGWRAAMDAVVKRDAPIPPTAREMIRLPASTAQVHGEKLRYEPQPQKNTLGYWVKADDWVEWTFSVAHPGRYDAQILQGCGKGSGGAGAYLCGANARGHRAADRPFPKFHLSPCRHRDTHSRRTHPRGEAEDEARRGSHGLGQITLLPAAP